MKLTTLAGGAWSMTSRRMEARILTYINPFLATTEGHDQLFQEAKSKGYLVQHADGSPYLIKNANFMVGMIDLSNPGNALPGLKMS